MNFLRQFLIILCISFVGEVCKMLLPFPVPASIYGIIILFLLLVTGLLKLEQIKQTADFLIEIMPVMFIPAAAGLLDSWGALSPILVPVAVITAVSTVIVMVVSGRTTQFVIRRQKKRQ